MTARRVWLNKKEGYLAALAWSVEPGPSGGGSGHISVRDCTRQVDLDFDWCRPKDEAADWAATLDDRIKKVDLILDELRAMRAELVKAKRARKAQAKRGMK